MRCHVGVDIGTTNTKVVLLLSSGKLVGTLTIKTPTVCTEGIHYFDLPKLEETIVTHLEYLKETYDLASVSVASVGESVVPVKNRKALALPLVWHEHCTQSTYLASKSTICRLAPYSRVGIDCSDITLSLYKMLWMLENLALDDVQYWLPLSSYLLYCLGAEPAWAESQACRSLMFDIHSRTWISELWDALPLRGSMGRIFYTGENIGQARDGMALVLSGHDHMTGLFGMYMLANKAPLVYHSMGSAALTAVIVEDTSKDELMHTSLMRSQEGTVLAGFEDGQYLVQNSFKYFSLIIEQVFRMCGLPSDEKHITQANEAIECLPLPHVKDLTVLMAERDPIFGSSASRICYFNVPLQPSFTYLLQCAYLYLAIASLYAIEAVSSLLSKPFVCYGGGGIAYNALFMKYLASATGLTIQTPLTREITALGAACAGIKGSRCAADIENVRAMVSNSVAEPDDDLRIFMQTVYAEYRAWQQKMTQRIE